MAVKAVLFDLDGTLLNTIDDIRDSMNSALEALSLPTHDVQSYCYFVGDGVQKLSERAVGDKNTQLVPEVLRLYRGNYAQNSKNKTKPYDGIEAMLTALDEKGIPMAVFSNKPDKDTKDVVAHYFPGISFAHVQGQLESVPVKPHPAGALDIARLLGVKPVDFLYVGDTGVDMRCAKAAGMQSVGATWGFRSMAELIENGAQHIIHAPESLLALLRACKH